MMKRLLVTLGLLGVFLLGGVVDRTPTIQRWVDPAIWFPGTPAEAFYRASIIKSIQRGTCTIAQGASSGTSTITAVVTANSVVTDESTRGGAGGSSDLTVNTLWTKLVLTNTTTVTCSVNTATASSTRNVAFTVLEFYPNNLTANAVQRGTIAATGGASTATAAITAVVMAKSWVPWSGMSTTSTANYGSADQWMGTLALTSTTVVTVTQDAAFGAATYTYPYQVVEFR